MGRRRVGGRGWALLPAARGVRPRPPPDGRAGPPRAFPAREAPFGRDRTRERRAERGGGFAGGLGGTGSRCGWSVLKRCERSRLIVAKYRPSTSKICLDQRR